MTTEKTYSSEYKRKVIQLTEIKRQHEGLTKKELCQVYGFSYAFYVNITTAINNPSDAMAQTLEGYIQTSSDKIYRQVFKNRKEEKLNQKLEISDAMREEFIAKMVKDGIVQE